MAKSEAEAKKLVLEKFHRWIKVFGKKQLERMPIRKLWDHAIDVKEGFMPRKGKVYLLSREEREEVREFIKEHSASVLYWEEGWKEEDGTGLLLS